MPKIKIKNLNTEINRRIKLIKTATSVVDIGQQQGAVVNQSDYVGICLAPLDMPTISCNGAIPTCELKNDSDGMHFMSINEILLNGVSYTRPDNNWGTDFIFPPNTIELVRNSRIRQEGNDFYWDYYIQVNNLSDKFMRIEFLGYFDTEAGFENTNPTLGFAEGPKAIVCLSPKANQISCEGATTEIYFPSIGGEWNIELDGVLYETHGASIGYFIRSTFSDILDCFDDGFMRLVNKDFLPHRIKFIPVQDTGYTAPEDNPTFMSHPDGSLTFCLAEKGIPLGCEGATSVLNFERLTGGNYSFGAVDEENNRYEYVAGTVDDIRTWLDNNSFVELTLNNDGFGYFTYTGSTYKKFYILMLNDGEMSIPTGNPTVTEVVGEQGYQWCMNTTLIGCEPTEFIMTESTSFEGGSVRLDYVIDAPDHGISNVSKRFSMTDIAQGTYLSEIVRDVIAQIKEDHSFIAFREGTGNAVANFDYWTYRSTTDGLFRLSGITGVISKDPITIKFVKNNINDDLFPLIFPGAASDGITEYSVHSCGTQDLPGI